MKDRPILFSGDMVRAIIAGRKRQTRRLIKLPDFTPNDTERWTFITDSTNRKLKGDFCLSQLNESGKTFTERGRELTLWSGKCPHGQVGDRLWVRETWKPGAWRDDGRVAIDYRASPEITNTPWLQHPEPFFGEKVSIKWCRELEQNGLKPDSQGMYHWEPGKNPLQWRPSIFMPRWASRIILEITAIWPERLNAISGMDASREGISPPPHLPHDGADLDFARREFQTLWDSLNRKKCPWASNPWVWVIDFKRKEVL